MLINLNFNVLLKITQNIYQKYIFIKKMAWNVYV